jgi:hypothetical protein
MKGRRTEPARRSVDAGKSRDLSRKKNKRGKKNGEVCGPGNLDTTNHTPTVRREPVD